MHGLLVWVSGQEDQAVANDAEHIRSVSLSPVVSKLNNLAHSSSKQVESVESEGQVFDGCPTLIYVSSTLNGQVQDGHLLVRVTGRRTCNLYGFPPLQESACQSICFHVALFCIF